MRIASLVILVAGTPLLWAQEPPKVSKVGATPSSPASGKEMFHSYCASCHGPDGKGNGPAATALKTHPTDLTVLAKQSGGKYPSMKVMTSIRDGALAGHGSKDMPIWGPILSSVSADDPGVVDQRVANLVAYIGTLQSK
jgi:mono/diheme cytochrome c family protein